MPVRVEWFTVKAQSTDGGTVEVLVPEAHLDKLFQKGPTRKYFDADLIPDTLRSPAVILMGLERAEFEDAFRYYGRPAYRWNGIKEVPPPQKKVFAVYVAYSQEKDSLVVIDWNWVPAHGTKAGFPECYQEKM